MNSEYGGLMRTWHRFVLRLCRPEERPWVEALWSELLEVEGFGDRLAWAAGCGGIASLSLRKRALSLVSPLSAAMALAMAATVLTAGLWRAGYEGIEGVEDFFLMFALLCGTIFTALFALAMSRTRPGPWRSSAG